MFVKKFEKHYLLKRSKKINSRKNIIGKIIHTRKEKIFIKTIKK